MNSRAIPEAELLQLELREARREVLSGLPREAARRLQALIGAPAYEPMLRYWLAAALGAAGDWEGHRAALREAQTFHALKVTASEGGDIDRLRTDPAYAEVVANQLYADKRMGPASLAFACAVTNGRPTAQNFIFWGLSLQHQGRIEEALDIFAAATKAYPSPQMHDYLLYACFFSPDGVRRHAEEVRRWAALYAPPFDPAKRFANPPQTGRRLRIGYVAPGFLNRQIKQFIEPVLDNHTDDVEVFLYAADAAGLAGARADVARAIGGLDDASAAQAIAADRIDVLVDLWGHTVHGRLGVFALKPAPVQAAWINYVQSTGLAAMDYVIHADGMHGPEDEALFVEKIWRAGPIIAPFRPGRRAPATPTPALRKGYVTFGSFNHPAKLSDATVDAWARILRGRPTARLMLKYGAFVDPVLRETTCARFAARGVDPDRLEFSGHSTGDAYLAAFGEMDLALDPSPCIGGTTSSEAVSQGVPLITLRGPDFYSRLGVLRLEPLGLHDLVAETWDDYVERALGVTGNPAALDELRQSMRARFDGSVLRDEAGFTRSIEATFRQMYALYEDRVRCPAGPWTDAAA